MSLPTMHEQQLEQRETMHRAQHDQLPSGELRENWGWFIGVGMLMTVMGIVSIVAANFATLATVLLFGVLLMLIGVAQIVQSVQSRFWSGFGLHLVGGMLYAVAGLMMFVSPQAGAMTLTLILAVMFIAGGVLRLILASRTRGRHRVTWLYVGGGLSLVLGLMIAVGWPAISAFVIGIFLGIELIAGGLGLLMLGIEGHTSRAT